VYLLLNIPNGHGIFKEIHIWNLASLGFTIIFYSKLKFSKHKNNVFFFFFLVKGMQNGYGKWELTQTCSFKKKILIKQF